MPASPTLRSALPHLDELFAVGPHAGAHRVAVRAGVSIAVPLVVLWALGRTDPALYAAFGAFTSLYGRQHTHRPRLRLQFSAAACLVATVTLGTTVALSPQRDWLVIPVVALVGAGATFLSDALHWHPPGPLFAVFAVTACASVPADLGRVPVAFAVAAASAGFALLIGVSGLAAPGARRLPPTPWRASFGASAARPATRAAMVRFAVVVVVAGAIPTATGLGHPSWAMVSAVAAVSGGDAAARLVRAGHRILGTVAGVAIAAVLLSLPLAPLATIAVVVLLQMAAELTVGRNYGITLVFVTPLAILMVELAHRTNALVLLRDRGLETAIGVAVGVVATLTAHVAAAAPRLPGRHGTRFGATADGDTARRR
ncbi:MULTISPECIES: FUSC family protein [unclassified Rathayibacter]|uniref:FUSC family protein n=1 Tax=unclassified Rathayibacter TaxID=2609250 RepID=UPI00188D09C6|nr:MULTISPECIES: FUSC family protein [unclassified Rathayibacter]MBF4463191.1 FUSC family protein [Rathayibacter sp. VKM Ac-2879]MBF4504572.1 FUSC family protein [Rathayibacter sp. VKM Ac-2878]